MKKVFTIIMGAICCSFASHTNSFATSPSNIISVKDTVYRLKEVEVTAQKREKANNLTRINMPISKLPITVSTLDAKQLTMRGIYETQEAFKFIPGVNGRVTYGGFNRLSIRGFDNQPIIVDGVRDERTTINSYPLSDLSDVESIEVLKGPAGVLQGHSAVGGILNITRKQPTNKTLLESRLSVASWKRKEASITLGGKIGNYISSIAGVHFSDGNGWRDTNNSKFKAYAALGSQWNNNYLQIRSSFYRDFYGTEIGLPSIFYQNVYNSDGSVYLKPGEMQKGIKRSARYNNESDFLYNRGWNVSARFDHHFDNGLKLSNQLSYSKDDIDYFGTEQLDYLTSKDPIYDHYIETSKGREYIDLKHLTIDFPLRFSHIANTVQNQLSLSGSFFTGLLKHNFATGYAFSHMHRVSYTGYKIGTDVQGPGITGVIDALDPHSMGYMTGTFSFAHPTNTMVNGLFLQDVVEISDQLQIMGGIRHDWYLYESAGKQPTIDGKRLYSHPASSAYDKSKNHALTYRLGLVYSPIKDLNFYTSVANFYTPLRRFYSDKVIYVDSKGKRFFPGQEEPFKPETGYQIELGSRINTCKYLSAQVSGFYIKQNNMVKNLGVKEEQDNNGEMMKKTIYGQIGSIISKGFEIELNSNPVKGLFLSAGYSYIDAKLDKVAKNNFLDRDITGSRLNNIPKNKLYTYGNYTIQKGELKGLGFRYSYSLTGKIYRNYESDIYFDAYGLLDLGASYTLKNHVTFSVDVYNVLNKDYYAASLGNQLVPGAPTNVRLSVSYRL